MIERRIAKITGWALLLMAIVAGFSIGYAFAEFNLPDQMDFLKDNILANKGLYQSMLIGILIILILDLLVSYTLYEYFKDDNDFSITNDNWRTWTCDMATCKRRKRKVVVSTNLPTQILATNWQQ